MKNHFIKQEKLNLFTKTIANKIQNGFVVIEQNEKTFTVRIPILTKQISVMETSTDYSDENKAYFRAKKRVEELNGFYGNIISYCCVIPFLVFINLRFSPGFQ